MDLVTVLLTSVGSVIALFLLTELMGKKQIAQLSMFDYINGITIGSIAAEMATSLEDDFLKPLLAMAIYALASILISKLSCKSLMFRKIFTGRPLILLERGKLYKNSLKKAKLDLNEFLTQCRNNGYFDINNIDTAVLEPNGKISFLPVSSQRPATPADLNVDVAQEKMPINIIVDGILLEDNLKYTGNNEIWLKKQLKAQGVSKEEDVFLATCNNNNELTLYLKIEK